MPNLKEEKSANVIPGGLAIQLFSSCRARKNTYTSTICLILLAT